MIKKIVDIVLVVAVLVFSFLFFKEKFYGDENVKYINGKPYKVIEHVVDTQYVTKTNVEYRDGRVIYKEKPIYVKLPVEIDTMTILKNYYSKVVYIDTFKLPDSVGVVTVKDTISQNSILYRKWSSEVNKIIIKDSVIVEKLPKNIFYIGGMAGVIQNVVPYIGPTISLKNKKDMFFSVGAGIGVKNTIIYQFGVSFPIKF